MCTCLCMCVLLFFFNSSLSSSHNAPSELNKPQFLVVMATARTAQRYYPRLWDTILWQGKVGWWMSVCVCVCLCRVVVNVPACNPLESIKQANQYQLHLSHLLPGLLLKSSCYQKSQQFISYTQMLHILTIRWLNKGGLFSLNGERVWKKIWSNRSHVRLVWHEDWVSIYHLLVFSCKN